MTGDRTDSVGMPPGWAAAQRQPYVRQRERPPDDGPSRATEVLAVAQRTAEDHIRSTRAEAESIRAQASSSAGEIVQDAEAQAERIRRQADQVLAEAKAAADELRRQANAEYDSVLDRLQADREALLRQIESLEQFDRQFRQRLLDFMQSQMRALLGDNPQAPGEPDEAGPLR